MLGEEVNGKVSTSKEFLDPIREKKGSRTGKESGKSLELHEIIKKHELEHGCILLRAVIKEGRLEEIECFPVGRIEGIEAFVEVWDCRHCLVVTNHEKKEEIISLGHEEITTNEELHELVHYVIEEVNGGAINWSGHYHFDEPSLRRLFEILRFEGGI